MRSPSGHTCLAPTSPGSSDTGGSAGRTALRTPRSVSDCSRCCGVLWMDLMSRFYIRSSVLPGCLPCSSAFCSLDREAAMNGLVCGDYASSSDSDSVGSAASDAGAGLNAGAGAGAGAGGSNGAGAGSAAPSIKLPGAEDLFNSVGTSSFLEPAVTKKTATYEEVEAKMKAKRKAVDAPDGSMPSDAKQRRYVPASPATLCAQLASRSLCTRCWV